MANKTCEFEEDATSGACGKVAVVRLTDGATNEERLACQEHREIAEGIYVANELDKLDEESDEEELREICAFLLKCAEEDLVRMKDLATYATSNAAPLWARLIIVKVSAQSFPEREGFSEKWTSGLGL